jgi:HSP20 family protein
VSLSLLRFNHLPAAFREFDSLLSPFSWPAVAPSIATRLHERGDGFELNIDLPGVAPENLKLEVEKDTLSIDFSRESAFSDHQSDDAKPSNIEQRRFSLPENVDVDGVKARLKNGVLSIHIPKKQKPAARQIQVQV